MGSAPIPESAGNARDAGAVEEKRGEPEMSESAIPTTTEDADARALATQRGLEYVEPGAVTIDPRALSVLPAEECRRLRAVPLSGPGDTAVVGVGEPSDERLDAVRSLTGAETRFVLLAERTLDALLRSRMFAPKARKAPAPYAPPAQPVERQVEPTVEPETPPLAVDPVGVSARNPVPAAQPAAWPAFDEQLVDAIVDALEPRLEAIAAQAAPRPAISPPASPSPSPEPSSPQEESTVWDLLVHVDDSIAAWSSVREKLQTIAEDLGSSKKSLRKAKENLSVAHAANDQHQRRIHELEAELAERRALAEEARLRLQDAADALGEHRLESPSELL